MDYTNYRIIMDNKRLKDRELIDSYNFDQQGADK